MIAHRKKLALILVRNVILLRDQGKEEIHPLLVWLTEKLCLWGTGQTVLRLWLDYKAIAKEENKAAPA